jgi:hypothetical protein
MFEEDFGVEVDAIKRAFEAPPPPPPPTQLKVLMKNQ